MLRMLEIAAIGYAGYRLGRRIRREWRTSPKRPATPIAPIGATAESFCAPINGDAPNARLDDANASAGAGARNDDIERGPVSRVNARLD